MLLSTALEHDLIIAVLVVGIVDGLVWLVKALR